MALDNKTQLSAAHISANLGQYEAARSGFFDLIVDDIDNILKASVRHDIDGASNNDVIQKAQNTLRLNVVSFDVPHFTLEQLTYRRGNDEVKFAGVPTFNSGSLKVDDVIGGAAYGTPDTKSILMAWQALAYDVNTRKGGRMKDYKKNATLIEYTQDFEEVRRWVLYGCWISEISEDAFDKENDGKRQMTATIQYDRAEMIMPDLA